MDTRKNCYATVLSRAPAVVLLFVFAISTSLTLIALFLRPVPDFADPTEGFDARYSDLGSRLVTWEKIRRQTTPFPTSFTERTTVRRSSAQRADNSTRIARRSGQCAVTPDKYVQLVVTTPNTSDLLTGRNLASLCSLEEKLSRLRSLSSGDSAVCYKQGRECCPIISFTSVVIRLLSGLIPLKCTELGERQIAQLRQRITLCSQVFHRGLDNGDCATQKADIMLLLKFLADGNFMKEKYELQATNIWLPIPTPAPLEVYLEYKDELEPPQELQIYASSWGLERELFSYYILHTSECYLFLAGAVASVILLLVIFLRSWLVSLLTLLSITSSLSVAYFFYAVVCAQPSFPFVNLMAVVLTFAVGADSALIFNKSWSRAISVKNPGRLENILSRSLRNSVGGLLIAGLTTTAVLAAGYFNAVTAVSQFSLFSCLAVFLLLIFSLVWTPAAFAFRSQCEQCRDCHNGQCCSRIDKAARSLFETGLPWFITRTYFFWAAVLVSLIAGSIVVIFYKPGLQLSEAASLQLFPSSHEFERYNTARGWFPYQGDPKRNLSLVFVWGFKPTHSIEKLEVDPNFDPWSRDAQFWLFNFCTEARNLTYYRKPNRGVFEYSNCFIEFMLERFEKIPCESTEDDAAKPCCNRNGKFEFPTSKAIFKQCTLHHLSQQQDNPVIAQAWDPDSAIRFDAKTDAITGMVVKFDTRLPDNKNFTQLENAYNHLDDWFAARLATAPTSLQEGWFVISPSRAYSLRSSLRSSTLITLGVGAGLAGLILVLVTCHPILAVITLVFVVSTVLCCVATFVLFGWTFDILESVLSCLLLGLSADYCCHVVAVWQCSGSDETTTREKRLKETLGRVGPGVTQAAITTLVPGLVLVASPLHVSQRLGWFLACLVFWSWLHAIILLPSVLLRLSPRRSCWQTRCCAENEKPKSQPLNGGPHHRPDSAAPSGDETEELQLTVVSEVTSAAAAVSQITRTRSGETETETHYAELRTPATPRRYLRYQNPSSDTGSSRFEEDFDESKVWVPRHPVFRELPVSTSETHVTLMQQQKTQRARVVTERSPPNRHCHGGRGHYYRCQCRHL